MSCNLNSSSNGGAGDHLFLNEDLSDVTILVQHAGFNTFRFPAHSLLLSSQSIVLRTMLSSNFSEKNSRQIIIKDFKPKAVELFLEYIYCGKVSGVETWCSASELLSVAHKYQVEPLVQNCSKFLENVLSISNVCYIYNKAFVFSLLPLKEKCLKLILDAGFVLLESKAFEMLHKESVLDIVSNPSLNVQSELTVFKALLNWAPIQCCRMGHRVTEKTILQELEPFLDYVCFDVMSDTDKSELPAVVLSCMKPNNRNRVSFYVPETLLPYAYHLDFQTDHEINKFIGESLSCIRFSVDLPLYLIGLRFVVFVSEFPLPFPLVITKESENISIMLQTINLSSASWKDGLQISDRKRNEAEILLRYPCKLESKTVYHIHCVDRTQNAQCPKTQLSNQILFTEKGKVNVSLHSNCTWGIAELIFV